VSLQGRRSLVSVQVAYSSDIRCAPCELRLTLSDTAASACLAVGRIIRLPRLLRLLNAQRKHRYNNHMSLTMLDKVQGPPICQVAPSFSTEKFIVVYWAYSLLFSTGQHPKHTYIVRPGLEKHKFLKKKFSDF